ncbi:MAG: von Willebrand factor type A domain-containing protein, partial [Planctomycetota bacterium]|nr:von Willebrand factor type A domain-containing protein [Planctomycetota bacterium]
MTNKENRKPNLDTKAPPQRDSELRYLLSAYLFDSLSEEGRAEVERQLEKSEACRRELDELRETLSLVSEALSDDAEQPSTYSFDQRRMDRVLSAKRRTSILRIRLPSRKITAAAAALLLTSLAGILGLMTYSSFEMADSFPRESSDSELHFAGEVLTLNSERRTGGLEPLSGESSPSSKPQQDADRAVRSAGRKLAPKTISQPEIMRKLGESRVLPPAKAAVSKNAERFYAEEEKFLPDNNEARRVTRKRTPSAAETNRSRSVKAKESAANKPASPTAPPAPTRKAEKARSEVSPPGQAIAEGKDVAVTDQIGVGGGAAGAYGHRYAKGRLVREKPRFGKSSPKAPPRSEQNRISSPRPPGATPAAPEETGAAITASSLDSLGRDGRASKEAVRESLKSLEKMRVTGGIRDRLKKDAADAPFSFGDQAQEQGIGAELSSVEAAEEEESEEEAKKSVLLQNLQEAQREGGYQRQGEQNFDLNIKKTEDGYKSLGLNQSASQQLRKQQAASAGIDTRTINEKVLNTFSWYRRLDPKLSYDQFNSRALVIPPPALGDEGLGEKGFRAKYGVNPFVAASRDNLSTFGMDVDTASWGRARESIRNKTLPAPQTIRVEEFINNFSDERPGNPNTVFSVYTEGGPSPFGDHGLELIQITLKSRELRTGERKDAILTFAIDTSGSMAADGKINLLKKSIRTLVDKLNP